MNYDIKGGLGGLPPIIMLIYINLDKYKVRCIPKQHMATVVAYSVSAVNSLIISQ